jgi:hypothetical protein
MELRRVVMGDLLQKGKCLSLELSAGRASWARLGAGKGTFS